MPANVLEEPAVVESTPREASTIGSTVIDPLENRAKQHVFGEYGALSLRQRIDVLLHDIFEGREEFLGWTQIRHRK